jgi:hypothetical protein
MRLWLLQRDCHYQQLLHCRHSHSRDQEPCWIMHWRRHMLSFVQRNHHHRQALCCSARGRCCRYCMQIAVTGGVPRVLHCARQVLSFFWLLRLAGRRCPNSNKPRMCMECCEDNDCPDYLNNGVTYVKRLCDNAFVLLWRASMSGVRVWSSPGSCWLQMQGRLLFFRRLHHFPVLQRQQQASVQGQGWRHLHGERLVCGPQLASTSNSAPLPRGGHAMQYGCRCHYVRRSLPVVTSTAPPMLQSCNAGTGMRCPSGTCCLNGQASCVPVGNAGCGNYCCAAYIKCDNQQKFQSTQGRECNTGANSGGTACERGLDPYFYSSAFNYTTITNISFTCGQGGYSV